jgi:manganese transport protein
MSSFWRKLLAFTGPGFLVAVGYMDPGNWATDLQGGAQFGYTLLSIILISNFMAILLQHLAIKLGIVTGRDLAQACRDHYPLPVVWFLWILCEIAIAACDLAEVVGSAIGLQLLFGIPLVWGCFIMCADVLAVLYLQNKGFRYIEALVITLDRDHRRLLRGGTFLVAPSLTGVLLGFVPQPEIVQSRRCFTSPSASSARRSCRTISTSIPPSCRRATSSRRRGKREAIKFATIDSTTALMFALFINAAILVVAAAAFHWSGHADVADIQDAYKLLARCSAWARPASSSRWRCWPPGRTPRSPARWPGRS